MADFAKYLREARQKAGLNQSELAESIGLTGSYISILEAKKKPAPSDRVVRELARALGRPESEMLEVAHLDRSPEDIRKKIRALDRHLSLERKVTKRLLTDILPGSLWHFWRVRGFSEYGLERIRLDGRRKAILRKVIRRIGHLTSRDDFEEESRLVIESLPVEERSVLAAVLPELTGDADSQADSQADSSAESAVRMVPVLTAPPGADPLEPLRLEPVAADGPGSWFLVAQDDSMAPRIEPGDLLLIAPRGELEVSATVVARRKSQVLVRQIATTDPLVLVGLGPRVPPETVRPSAVEGRVVEVRRPLPGAGHAGKRH